MNFSDWLQNQILRSGYTRKEIAKLAGMPKNEMDSICNGELPKRYRIGSIAYALNLNKHEVEDALDSPSELNLGPVNIHPVADLKKVNEKSEKPGMKPKSTKIKNSAVRLHDLTPPKEKHCRWCNVETGSENFRHCEIPLLKHRHGKGWGVKIDDNLSVWGCAKCDSEMSQKPFEATETEMLRWENKWLIGICESHLV